MSNLAGLSYDSSRRDSTIYILLQNLTRNRYRVLDKETIFCLAADAILDYKNSNFSFLKKRFWKKRQYASAQHLSTKSDNFTLIYSDITTFKRTNVHHFSSNSTDGLTDGRKDTNAYCDHLADDHGTIYISDCDTHNVYLSSCLLSGTPRLPDFVKIRRFSVLFVIWWNWIHGRDNYSNWKKSCQLSHTSILQFY